MTENKWEISFITVNHYYHLFSFAIHEWSLKEIF